MIVDDEMMARENLRMLLNEFCPEIEVIGTAENVEQHVYFVEKGVSLLRQDGFFSYVVANKWLRANYGKPLRQWMKQQKNWEGQSIR